MLRSAVLAVIVLSQTALLLAAGGATIYWSRDLMPWVINMVGSGRALGPSGVLYLEDGRVLLDSPDLFGWTMAIMALVLVQITAAITLFWLWCAQLKTRRAREVAALVLLLAMVILGLCAAGCSGPPPETRTVKQASHLVLYEGLPHHLYEPRALEKERKSKPIVELHGFPFYRETLELKPGDGDRLKALLGDPSPSRPTSARRSAAASTPITPSSSQTWTRSTRS